MTLVVPYMKAGVYFLHNVTHNSEQDFALCSTAVVSFEMRWKGMDPYRGISALVLVLLELPWGTVAAGITRPSSPSHLSPFL